MSNILQLNQPQDLVGLGTMTITIPASGIYNAQAQINVPSAVATGDGAGSGNAQPGTPGPSVVSGLSVVVKQNGTTVYTAPTLSRTQSAQQFKTDLVCTTNDVITVVLSSSTASDETLNGVKSQITVAQGM
jgi:hypothetical protein